MRTGIGWLLLLCAVQSPPTLRGQQAEPFRIEMGAGLASVDQDEGFDFSLGFSGVLGFAQLRLLLPDFAWVLTDPKAGYERIETIMGSVLCRNLSTGEFVDEGPCDEWEARFAAMTELSVSVLNRESPLRLGGGYRTGSGAGAYGVVTYGPTRNSPGGAVYFQCRAGADFYQLMIGMSFWPWASSR